jgi:hypothetical protein
MNITEELGTLQPMMATFCQKEINYVSFEAK